jgi:transcriptional regulator with XRE-family HTH domain
MAPKERAVDRGSRLARRLLIELGREIREARLASGLTQAQVALACGLAPSYISRIERGMAPGVSVYHLARILSVVGLDLTARAYPAGSPVRDAGHLALLGRLRARISPTLEWRTEVPLPLPGDLRAWDGRIGGPGFRCGVEAEMRPRDLQALDRRLSLKKRDGGVDHVVLVLADTRANRALMREFGDALRVNYPLDRRVALAALEAGRDPGGSAIILL